MTSNDCAVNGHQNLPSLDWIRAIAIVFIIILHAGDKYAANGDFSGRWLIALGIEAVVRNGLLFFFLLSGFLLLRPFGHWRGGTGFYKKRLTRILPLFFLWSYIYFFYSTGSCDLISFVRKMVSEPVYYHLWYVYVIAGIYLVTPFVANIITGASYAATRNFVLFSIIVYSFVPFLEYYHINHSLYEYLVPFWCVYFLGGYILKIYINGGAGKSWLHVLLYLASTLAVFLMSFFREDYAPAGYSFAPVRAYDSNIFMFTASLTLFALLYKTFSRPPPTAIRFLAGRSYGIYLSHALFLSLYNRFVVIKVWYLDYILCVASVLLCCVAVELALLWSNGLWHTLAARVRPKTGSA